MSNKIRYSRRSGNSTYEISKGILYHTENYFLINGLKKEIFDLAVEFDSGCKIEIIHKKTKKTLFSVVGSLIKAVNSRSESGNIELLLYKLFSSEQGVEGKLQMKRINDQLSNITSAKVISNNGDYKFILDLNNYNLFIEGMKCEYHKSITHRKDYNEPFNCYDFKTLVKAGVKEVKAIENNEELNIVNGKIYSIDDEGVYVPVNESGKIIRIFTKTKIFKLKNEYYS